MTTTGGSHSTTFDPYPYWSTILLKCGEDLLALPARMGGMGLVNPVSSSQHVFNASLQLTSPLVSTIASQDQNQRVDIGRVMEIKASIRQSNQKYWLQKSRNVCDQLSPQLKHYVDLTKEKVPLHGSPYFLWMIIVFPFTRVHLVMQYAFVMAGNCQILLPNVTVALPFLLIMPMICPMGGFPKIRHNEFRDITASLLSEVCHNVATELPLQPLSGESMTYQTAVSTNDARLDIHARGFWSAVQDAYFDVRVFFFHPNALSNSSGTIPAKYTKHENIKKRAYGQHVQDVEHGVLLL